MIEPLPRSIIDGRTYFDIKKAPLRLESMVSSQQHVDLAEAYEGLFDRPATLVSEAHIGADEQGLAAIRDDSLDHLLPTLGIAPGDSDRRSLACEAHGSGAADSRGSPGYQGYLSFQPHALSLISLPFR
jgi:hypothetical protein